MDGKKNQMNTMGDTLEGLSSLAALSELVATNNSEDLDGTLQILCCLRLEVA
jgi:hypothetical protein